MAVEIIFQCGDKDNICKAYDTLLEQLQQETKRLEMIAENLDEKQDTLTLHSDRENLLSDVRKAENEKEQMQARKDGLLEDIGVLDKEFEKRLDFINVLDKLKAIFYNFFL